ncbi:hypothetical protein CFP56_000690 [Quercus suber]|uniref:Uncharacterized protein n=1 Tax=Quercus suber TaxID=58331 RepID=A0AAW0LHZ0_QUESU
MVDKRKGKKKNTSKTRKGDIEDQISKKKVDIFSHLEISYPDLDPAESFILVEFELKVVRSDHLVYRGQNSAILSIYGDTKTCHERVDHLVDTKTNFS